jgi:uncharacterized membrane protein YphA (DoxX/SURF4 family)
MSAKLPTVARILLGLVFFVLGLNGFLHFIPGEPPPGPAGAFAGALLATGYMFPLIKGTEVVASLLLLSGRFVPLSLVLLAPVLVNIALFHFVLEPKGAGMAVVLLALEGYLAWTHRSAYAPLFRATPASAPQIPAGHAQTA